MPEPLRAALDLVGDDGRISSSWLRDAGEGTALLVLGHGAGSNARSELIERLSVALCERGVSTLLFNYPYSEQGRKRPDHASILKKTVRLACEAAREMRPAVRLFAGGHSMSGRMVSMAEADEPLGLQGIVFFAFPLAGKAAKRTPHLASVQVPMLFVQGTRDRLTPLTQIEPVVGELCNARLAVLDGADHSFKVLKRSGRTWEDALAQAAETTARWMARPPG